MKDIKIKAKSKGISATNYMLKVLTDSLESKDKEEKNNLRLDLIDIMYKLNYHIAGLSTCSLNINERVDSYKIFEESYNKLSGIKIAKSYAEKAIQREKNSVLEEQSKKRLGTFYEKKSAVAPSTEAKYDYKKLLRESNT